MIAIGNAQQFPKHLGHRRHQPVGLASASATTVATRRRESSCADTDQDQLRTAANTSKPARLWCCGESHVRFPSISGVKGSNFLCKEMSPGPHRLTPSTAGWVLAGRSPEPTRRFLAIGGVSSVRVQGRLAYGDQLIPPAFSAGRGR